jgi:hypothetical protein
MVPLASFSTLPFFQALLQNSSTMFIFGGITSLQTPIIESNTLWWLDLSDLLSNASTPSSSQHSAELNLTLAGTIPLAWQSLSPPQAAGSVAATINALTSACAWPPSRNSARMAVLAGHLILFGGLRSSTSPDSVLSDTWAFQHETSTWARYVWGGFWFCGVRV